MGQIKFPLKVSIAKTDFSGGVVSENFGDALVASSSSVLFGENFVVEQDGVMHRRKPYIEVGELSFLEKDKPFVLKKVRLAEHINSYVFFQSTSIFLLFDDTEGYTRLDSPFSCDAAEISVSSYGNSLIFCHRSIKPQIFVRKSSTRLRDFGLIGAFRREPNVGFAIKRMPTYGNEANGFCFKFATNSQSHLSVNDYFCVLPRTVTHLNNELEAQSGEAMEWKLLKVQEVINDKELMAFQVSPGSEAKRDTYTSFGGSSFDNTTQYYPAIAIDGKNYTFKNKLLDGSGIVNLSFAGMRLLGSLYSKPCADGLWRFTDMNNFTKVSEETLDGYTRTVTDTYIAYIGHIDGSEATPMYNYVNRTVVLTKMVRTKYRYDLSVNSPLIEEIMDFSSFDNQEAKVNLSMYITTECHFLTKEWIDGVRAKVYDGNEIFDRPAGHADNLRPITQAQITVNHVKPLNYSLPDSMNDGIVSKIEFYASIVGTDIRHDATIARFGAVNEEMIAVSLPISTYGESPISFLLSQNRGWLLYEVDGIPVISGSAIYDPTRFVPFNAIGLTSDSEAVDIYSASQAHSRFGKLLDQGGMVLCHYLDGVIAVSGYEGMNISASGFSVDKASSNNMHNPLLSVSAKESMVYVTNGNQVRCLYKPGNYDQWKDILISSAIDKYLKTANITAIDWDEEQSKLYLSTDKYYFIGQFLVGESENKIAWSIINLGN